MENNHRETDAQLFVLVETSKAGASRLGNARLAADDEAAGVWSPPLWRLLQAERHVAKRVAKS